MQQRSGELGGLEMDGGGRIPRGPGCGEACVFGAPTSTRT